ncbi:MAG: VWA domain-containing protein [Pseudomonadota bacterium]
MASATTLQGIDGQLAGFVRALRAAGAEASVAEAIDAARAVALVGYADRDTLKSSLSATLAKSEEEKAICDEVFELFFRLPERSQAADQPQDANGQGDGSQPAPRTGDAEVDALLDLAEQQADGDAGAMAAALQRAGQKAGVDDIRFQSQTAYLARQLLEAMGIRKLEQQQQLLQQQADGDAAEADGEGGTALRQTLAAARARLQRQARAHVEQRFALFGKPATEAFMAEVAVQRPLGRMSPADMDRMKTAVARMAKRLAQRHSHRKRITLRGQLDLRRTIRANAGHDGVPVKLHFKHKRVDKPRIVAVCDVSGSVAAHVRFLLLFLYALQGTVADLRAFAFSNRLRDVGPPLDSLPFDDAMALILKEVGGGSTDYGQAWQDLYDQHWNLIDGRTTVLVLGDGRSNQTNPRLDLFAELAARAKHVVWLSPEGEGRWGTGDSALLQYRPFCTHLSHAATAADLERAIDEALSAYG